MGLNFRKSFKLGKFFRINLSKSGVGWSVGRKGVRYTHSATGSKRATLSLPGTGLSYTVPLGKKKKKTSAAKKKTKPAAVPTAAPVEALPQPTVESRPAATTQPTAVTPENAPELFPTEASAQPFSFCPQPGEYSVNTTAFHASGVPITAPDPSPAPSETTAEEKAYSAYEALGLSDEFDELYHSDTDISAADPAAPTYTPPEPIVYFSAAGKCYHFNPGCSGQSFMRSAAESEAVSIGKTPCSKCAAPGRRQLS